MNLFKKVKEVVSPLPSFDSGKRPVGGDGWDSFHINGVPYKAENGFWVRDEEAILRRAEREQHRRDLVWALQSRILTDTEMAEVARHDYHLLVQDGVPYYETDVRKQFGEMLLLQFKLKVAAQNANSN